MFNSKFNVGILKHPGYNVGGGIGEAALLGAAFGGAKSLATGEDLLEGALLGGITGGAMSGVTGAIFGNAGTTAATTAATTTEEATKLAAEEAARQTAASSANMLTPYASEVGGISTAAGQGIPSLAGQVAPNYALQGGYTAGAAIPSGQMMAGQAVDRAAEQAAASSVNANIAPQMPSGGGGISDMLGQSGLDLRQYTTPDTMMGKGLDWWEKQGLGGRAMYSGLGGAAYGAMNPKPVEMPKTDEKKSPLAGYDSSEFTPYEAQQPNPYYRAQYAEGGIAALAQGGMGSNVNFPQGRLDATQYATPTQMPTSAQVVNADYEAKTDPYTGSPLKMAEGGVAHYALGGATANTGGQVYYDPDKGQYYTLGAPNMGSMSGFALNPYGFGRNAERNYIGASLGGTSTPGVASDFQYNQVTPQVYQQPVTQIAQAATDPAVQQAVLGGSDYSLADSLPLLQATSPGIAAMYSAPAAPAEVEKKAEGGIAGYNLGGYASGGNPRLLKGPGDGMSDNIPATIGGRQPARLADGEFVVPADVVSHLGNGSTDAGAKHLYGMMDKVRKARTGSKKQGKQINPAKYMPA